MKTLWLALAIAAATTSPALAAAPLPLPAEGPARHVEAPVPNGATPLTLDAAIARALQAHPDMLAADVGARDAELGVADAQSQRMQLVAEVSSLGRHAQSGILEGDSLPAATQLGTANTNVELRVPLFTGFKISNNVKAAEYRKAAATTDRTQSAAALRFEVTRAFWNLRRQERLEAEQAQAIEQAAKSLALVRARHKQGTATPLDVDRAEVDMLAAQGDLLATGSNTREARARLAGLLGAAPEQVAITEPEAEQAGPRGGAVPPPAGLHARIATEENRVQAARAQAEAAQGDRWPQLGLVSAYQHGNNPYNPNSGVRGVNGSLSGTFDVRLGLTYNLFDMGNVGRSIERADNERKLAEANLDRARREVATQVALTEGRKQAASDRVAVAEAGARLAERALKYAETRWAQGYASQVEVLDARRALLKARTQRVDATYDLHIATAELAFARGLR